LSQAKPNANFPLLMNLMNYSLLSLFLVRRYHRKKQQDVAAIDLVSFPDDPYDADESNAVNIERDESADMSQKCWYFLAAVLDVEANFLVLKAYNYTTITSVMLLDCFTIPCAMALSFIFLGYRYTSRHLLGMLICLSGLACIIISDSIQGSSRGENSSNATFGDVLCLSGAALYASSNVLQEALVKRYDRDAFLGYLGSFGMLLAFTQCMALELPGIRDADWSVSTVLSLSGFVTCLFLMYVNTSAYLQGNDAILFNLSLLTSDVYAVLFRLLFEGYLVSYLYFLAFALVLLGLLAYHSEHTPSQLGNGVSVHVLRALCQGTAAWGQGSSQRSDCSSNGGGKGTGTGTGPGPGSAKSGSSRQLRFEYNPIVDVLSEDRSGSADRDRSNSRGHPS
jgi:solute carrier family 35 protein F1/2